MLKKVEGKFGMSATLLAYSVSTAGVRIATFELEYPRMILAELNTHRALSRNSASSRAIPLRKMVEQLRARPVRFGEANPGMQDKGEDFGALVQLPTSEIVDTGIGPAEMPSFPVGPEKAWEYAKNSAVEIAEAFFDAGYHKQVYNRLVEPFQMMKTVVTATELANFLWLRDHEAADPTIEHLAKLIRECLEGEEPTELYPGEWHLPYVDTGRDESGGIVYSILGKDGEVVELDTEAAIKVSSARSAAVSFRNVDYGVEKSEEVYGRLVGDERKHASALEHQAMPMMPMTFGAADDQNNWNIPTMPHTWERGVSHMDRQGRLWSGNFRGWVQFRKTVCGECVEGFFDGP